MIPADQPWVSTLLILVSCFIGFILAAFRSWQTSRITLSDENSADRRLLQAESGEQMFDDLRRITDAISTGAISFLTAEYKVMAIFMIGMALLILFSLSAVSGWANGGFSAIAFLLGSSTSILAGYIGMKIAVFANGRVALEARKGYGPAYKVAFHSGSVMGFALTASGLLVLFVGIVLFGLYFYSGKTRDVVGLYEAIAAYGLGGSSIALFGRVGGGIYTKAADVGADLVGKVEKGIPEDDPRNPAVIADNVGDNVGDIAGMGSDLFGSFAESSCAAMVVASKSPTPELINNWNALAFPLMITAMGLVVGALCTLHVTLRPVKQAKDVEPSLKWQLILSTGLATPGLLGIAYMLLPNEFVVNGITTTNWKVFFAAASGLWSGLIVGYITEYYTSHTYSPVRDVADSTKTGAATVIIYGLALGYKSVVIPTICLAVTIFVSHSLAAMYGVGCAALGILCTMSTGLAIDAYGPISDNAGGIAEMCHMGAEIRERTDTLDAAGNTTAAIGKGFAIGSAALVSLALFGAFVTRTNIEHVDLFKPFEFSGLVVGAMLPYFFSAMTIKSVGKAALAMVVEVRRQFKDIPGLMEGSASPDYTRCVDISTKAALKEMLAPGVLVMGTPLLVGFIFGTNALCGVLAGALVSGVQMAISSSNTGGAWDNAKKYIETGELGGKGSENHHAAVIGDTVGDPLKDTSGPSLNILMKLMAILSLVFAPFLAKYSLFGPGGIVYST